MAKGRQSQGRGLSVINEVASSGTACYNFAVEIAAFAPTLLLPC
jgi:hypothetical protein